MHRKTRRTLQPEQGDSNALLRFLPALSGFFMLAGLYPAAAAFFPSMPWVLAGGAATALMLLTCLLRAPGARLVRRAMAGVCCLAGAVFFSGFSAGLLYFANQIVALINARYETYWPLFAQSGASAPARALVLIVLSVVLAAALGGCVARQWPLWAGALGFGLLLSAGAIGVLLPAWAPPSFLLGWLMLLTGDTLFRQGKRALPFASLFAIVLALLMVFATSAPALHSAAQLRQSLLGGIDTLRYGTATLPEGDLTESAARYAALSGPLAEESALEITLSELPVSRLLHLRGYVGGSFDGTRWATLSRASYTGEAAGMLDWLSAMDFSPPLQYAAYLRATGTLAPPAELSVKNTGAYRKYEYLPYTAVALRSGTRGSAFFDWQYRRGGLVGARSYRLSAVQASEAADQLPQADLISNALAADYSQAETVYRTFVYENYLQLSEEDAALLDEALFGEEWEGLGLAQITTRIRLKLEEYADYSGTPDAFTGETGFVSWFLQGGHMADKSSYATMAVLAYRAAGIPARYVEGYVLSSDALAETADGEFAQTLTGKDAGAWAEVYLDGAGWLPVEVIPGSYYAEYTTTGTIGVPQTSVNVVPSGAATSSLNGTTADTLTGKDAPGPQMSPPPTRVLHLLGAALAVLCTALVLFALVRAQSAVRVHLWHRHQKTRPQALILRSCCQRVWRALRCCGLAVDEARPAANEAFFSGGAFAPITVDDYRRFVALLQKQTFGGASLTPAELYAACAFTETLAQCVSRRPGLRTHIAVRYLFALY